MKFESTQTLTSLKFVSKRCRKCRDKPNFAPIKLAVDSYLKLSHLSVQYFSLQSYDRNCARVRRLTAVKRDALSLRPISDFNKHKERARYFHNTGNISINPFLTISRLCYATEPRNPGIKF